MEDKKQKRIAELMNRVKSMADGVDFNSSIFPTYYWHYPTLVLKKKTVVQVAVVQKPLNFHSSSHESYTFAKSTTTNQSSTRNNGHESPKLKRKQMDLNHRNQDDQFFCYS